MKHTKTNKSNKVQQMELFTIYRNTILNASPTKKLANDNKC